MNPRTLPVKRRPVPSGFFKRIHAVTRNRNQRVAATATAEDLENGDHSARISRGFTIIFLIHVVAIALYFIHLNFLNDHSVAKATLPATTETATSAKPRADKPPILTPDDATCIVVAGDNYARIAAREGVDEAALRAANQNKPIAAGLTFKLPPKRIIATEPPLVVALRKQTPPNAERGLVEPHPLPASEPARPLLVHPRVVHETLAIKTPRDTPTARSTKDTSTTKTAKDSATVRNSKDSNTAKTAKDTASAKTAKDTAAAKTAKDTAAAKSAKDTAAAKTAKDTAAAKTARESTAAKATSTTAKQNYVVKSGDNLYRISKHYKIDQAALMRANNISDPAKLKSGMTLVIPH